MSNRSGYPHAPDQQFGARGAADVALLDRLLALFDGGQPRVAVARSDEARPSGAVAGPRWNMPWRTATDPLAGPCTTASALDAATRVRSDG